MALMQMMAYASWAKGKGKGWGSRGGLSSFPAEQKVWVGGLPEDGSVTFRDLQAHFGTVGTAKFATVMKGKGAGTGGVVFASAEEAKMAIEKLNGSTLAGKTIEVDVWTK